jgi:hypothetical protein
MGQSYAYLGRWNYKLNKPILGEEWISEEEARRAYEERTRMFDIVAAEIAQRQTEQPRPTPAWVLTSFADGPTAFNATFVNRVGSIWRIIEYDNQDGRLFKATVLEYTYPDETHRYRQDECTMLLTGGFNPDGTGSLTVNDKSKPTIDRLSMDQVDVSRHWMDRPEFGNWEHLTDPEFGTPPRS